MRVMPSMFELVYNGENAFHITITNFYMIESTNAPEILSILGFLSCVLVKGLDNSRRLFLSSVCSQAMMTNDIVLLVLSMYTGYYTFSEFIDAVDNEMVKVLSLIDDD